jgi:hypothetical protein
MWDRVTSADIEEARASLEAKRAETLSRHAEEIKGLDAQLQDIETFERVVDAFFEEYMSPETAPAMLPTDSAEPQPNAPPLALQIQQQVSPPMNWAGVFRKARKDPQPASG